MNTEVIAEQLDLWPAAVPAKISLINLSENHTFGIEGDDAVRRILRVHRPGYQDDNAIRSELMWLEALRTSTDVTVPTPICGADGHWVQKLQVNAEEAPRSAVMFAFIRGDEPCPEAPNLPSLFETVGEIAAKCHDQAQNWVPPKGFNRPIWNVSTMLGEEGLWGDWRCGPNLTDDHRKILDKAQQSLAGAFEKYGADENKFGLIHADMRLANLLVRNDQVTVLDFDDCGFGWFVYDFAASISFFENQSNVAELKRRWLKGYKRHRAFDDVDLGMFDSAIMLRRMLLLAWIGSHLETELAQSHAKDFAQVTTRMAEKYLTQIPLS